MTTDPRKIIASIVIAVLALSILSIVTPAYSEHPTNDQVKEKKVAKQKAKAKQHEEEQKEKAQEHVKEAKTRSEQNKDKQEQQVTSATNSTSTAALNHTGKRSEVTAKLLKGSIFSLAGTGEARKRDGNETTQVSAKFELAVFRATPHMILLKVDSGSITIGNETHSVEKGKAVLALKAHKMIFTAQISDEHGKKTLKLMGSPENSTSENTDDISATGHKMQLKGKLADWVITISAEITKSG